MPDRNGTLDAIVVGAGPAGLASARELIARGLRCELLEAGDEAGWSWRHYYDSLVLHTARRLSAMPGFAFGPGAPQFVPRTTFVEYLDRYARHFHLPIRTGARVDRLEPGGAGWRATWRGGELEARTAIVASGIATNPVRPHIPGLETYAGYIRHSIDYRSPATLPRGSVLVVGAGNSGAEIAAELGHAGIATAISIRSGVTVVPREVLGIPSQTIGLVVRRMPRPLTELIVRAAAWARERRYGPSPLPQGGESPLDALPLIGFHLSDAVAAGRVQVRPGVVGFDDRGVIFADGSHQAFDVVLLATGFRPAIGFLNGLIEVDERGFARRDGRVASADAEGLYFVGHNYDASGGLYNIRRDAPLAADAVLARVGRG